MRKLIAVVIALLSFSVSAFATVAVNDIDGYVGEVTNVYVEGQDVSFDGSQVTILANGHKEGATANVSTESNLTSAALAYGIILLEAGSAKSIALADGTPGQMITIISSTYDGKTITITDDSVNDVVFGDTTATGWDDIAVDTAFDSITLLFLDTTYGWIIVANNGCTIT
jgi:hypothetical protein